YESNGTTRLRAGGTGEPTTNAHYFTELAQRTIRTLTQIGPLGKLYSVDMRLRPFGQSGSLVLPLAEFQRYFAADGDARIWERQALGRARVIDGDPAFASRVQQAVYEAMTARPWRAECVGEIRGMR